MISSTTRIITRSQVVELLGANECIVAIENVFKLQGKGLAKPPAIMGIHATNGGFHIKAGILDVGRNYFVAKTNANFPNNSKLHSLPTIQGVVSVFDADNGRLLALMDSIELTILRTGAATAVAAKYLANPDSTRLTICGCGNQGRVSLRMLSQLFSLKKIYAYDVIEATAKSFASEMSEELSSRVEVITNLDKAVGDSHICVTGTPSKKPFLKKLDVAPGTFIAAVGADSEEKQELESELTASSRLVVDITEQCATIGELHHALEKKLMTRDDVYATLGDVVAGKVKGRTSTEEIIIFDSTGMALQDVAAAAIVYEKALQKPYGLKVSLGK